MRVLGIIPARSGSKGVPDKNIVNLNNKPLIYWTIKEALKSKKYYRTPQPLHSYLVLGKGIARKDYHIFDKNQNKIGIVTSGTMSPSLNKAIGMAYINIEYNKPNQEFMIQVRNKFILAKVAELPFVK